MARRVFDKDREPWERQTGEPVRSYALFTEFLRVKASERRLRTFAEAQDVKLESVQGMHAQWRWGDRIGAYEANVDRQTLKATGEYNKKAAADLAVVMTKVPEAARKALEMGIRTLDDYMSDPEHKLNGRDAVQLLSAANNLMIGLTRYLETAGQLSRSLNIQVFGRVEHALAAPEAADLIRFLGALQETGQIAPDRRNVIEAQIVQEMGDPLALERVGDLDGNGEPGSALPLGGEDQPLSLEAER